jgi:hypothetical protein
MGAGIDVGPIASNLLSYLGGAAGGYMAAAIILIVFLLAGAHVLSGRHTVESAILVAFAWSAVHRSHAVARLSIPEAEELERQLGERIRQACATGDIRQTSFWGSYRRRSPHQNREVAA